MNNLIISAAISFLAMLFGVAKDGRFGKVDATFLLTALIGILGWFCTLKGIGLEFVLKLTPLDGMVLFNLILSGVMVILPTALIVKSLRDGGGSSVLLCGIVLSLVGYIFLPNFVASALVFVPEIVRNYIPLALFAVLLFFVEFFSSRIGGEE